MSDLEDDVLMAFLALSRQMEQMKQRNLLVEVVWKDLDKLVRALLREPTTARAFQRELLVLKDSIVAVLTFDEDQDAKTS
jgi:hypothetical protein